MGKLVIRSGVALAAGLLVAGCDSGTGPDDGFGLDDAAFVAVENDIVAGAMIFDLVGVGHSVRARPGQPGPFERTRECPAGGSMSISGTTERTEHGDGSVEVTLAATGTWDACAHTRNRGDRAITTTMTGTFAIDAQRRHNNRVPIGNQTTHKTGAFTWARTFGDETRTGECSFDVTSVRNPDSRRTTITGTICGREINRTITWRDGT